MTTLLSLPGIGGSGPRHWQTRWEAMRPGMRRIRPPSWETPELEAWLAALDMALEAARAEAVRPVVLVAHSLGCLLAVHALARGRQDIAGAFLVAVPDPDAAAFPAAARSFAPVPDGPLPVPTRMVMSANDPYGGAEYARRRAVAWRADLVEVGPRGHLNDASGLGAWPAGLALLDAFRAGLPLSGR